MALQKTKVYKGKRYVVKCSCNSDWGTDDAKYEVVMNGSGKLKLKGLVYGGCPNCSLIPWLNVKEK